MTAAYTPSNLLGIGIYTPAEAAKYARVSTSKLVRWVVGTATDRPAVVAQLDTEGNSDRWVTFLDFVQSMAIRDIRNTHRIHLDKIRETIEMSKSKFGVDYPFARKHTTYLRGEHLSLDITGYGLVESTGPHKSQMNMRQVVERYLEDLSYDADGLAARYVPFSWKGYDIVFNPHVRFGEPVVTRAKGNKGKLCRYSVGTLADAYEAEGTYAAVAKAYGVSEEAVEAACKYNFDYLITSVAA